MVSTTFLQLGRTSIKKSLKRAWQDLAADQGLVEEAEVEEDSDAEVGDDTEEEMKEVTDMADSAQSLLTPPVSQSEQKVDMTLI